MLNPRGTFRFVLCVGLLSVLTVAGWAQSQPSGSSASQSAPASPQNQQDQKDQSIPDAPSAVQPAKPAPTNLPGAESQPAPPSEQQAPPESETQPAPRSDEAAPPTGTVRTNPATLPPINIRTVPQGGATNESGSGQDELFTIVTKVNQVLIPVLVKDEGGRLVNGLSAKDFSVLENGKKQTLNFFTADPFALSAAVIIDLGMKDIDVQKVHHTFPALQGAFTQFDEVSLYTFSNTVGQLSGWGAVGQQLEEALQRVEDARGVNNGPPVVDGPLGPGGPMINNLPVNPAQTGIGAPVQQAHVLNDALLKAAIDLSHRDKTRRKIIFIISDGREYRSNASYHDVLQVLLKNNIMVYAIGLGGSAMPVYNTLARLHIPHLGYTDILPKYVNATGGGQIFEEQTRNGIEDAYAQALGDARNQYTMGYIAPKVPATGYRTFEVRVDRPSCKSSIRPCVNVFAPDGYYPAPPASSSGKATP